MESLFKCSFRSFLESSYIDFMEQGLLFVFPDFNFVVQLVPSGQSQTQLHTSANMQQQIHLHAPSQPEISFQAAAQFRAEKSSQAAAQFRAEAPSQPEALSQAALFSQPQFYDDIVFLYEDRWWGDKAVVQERILSRLERFKSIFARKCNVLSGRNNVNFGCMVNSFLDKYHSYSSTKCRYRFALEYQGDIVAVATFSQPRPMVRNVNSPLLNIPKPLQGLSDIVVFNSYEWIRYASLPGVRVVGGMGRLLSAFIKERIEKLGVSVPIEVMTYSDTEWSNGNVYKKLGFEYAGERAPVEYFVNKQTFKRYSLRLYQNLLEQGANPDNFYSIYNKGSRKFLLQLSGNRSHLANSGL